VKTLMIKSESGVRKWVREQFGDAAVWIEHSAGGSVGMPDCMILHEQMLWPVELKYGSMNNGYWSGELRPAQVRVANQMAKHGVVLHILVGSEFDNVLWLVSFQNYFFSSGNVTGTKMEPVNDEFGLCSALTKSYIG
jgi:hypothetical protein